VIDLHSFGMLMLKNTLLYSLNTEIMVSPIVSRGSAHCWR